MYGNNIEHNSVTVYINDVLNAALKDATFQIKLMSKTLWSKEVAIKY